MAGKFCTPSGARKSPLFLFVHGYKLTRLVPLSMGMDFAKTVVSHLKEVVQRSSIRGFRDDYHDVDADVVVLAGETHLGTKPVSSCSVPVWGSPHQTILQGAMRFTGELARNRYASTVVHSLIPPQKVFDLAEVLSSRMRSRTEGRLWMGAHMRRGDCK